MFPEPTTTERLRLRRPRPEDAEFVFRGWAGSPDAVPYVRWPVHPDAERTRAFIEECIRAWETDSNRYPWVVSDLEDADDRPVGMVELNVDVPRATLGYIVATEQRGRGFATEVAKAVVSMALDDSSISRVSATVDIDNQPSIRVLENIRMHREATLRRFENRPNLSEEHPRDVYLYSRLDVDTHDVVYERITGELSDEQVAEVSATYKRVFNERKIPELNKLLATRPAACTELARAEGRSVGFKIGFERSPGQYYSWLGGVDPDWRRRRIATRLLRRQHRWAREAGYRAIRTKTKNEWRGMIILNLREGFDVLGSYTDNDGRRKLILEKQLNTK